MKKGKKPNVLKELRDIRENLSVEYWQHPEKLQEALKAVREKFVPAEKPEKVKKTK
ncbi:hypothetical protein [Chitinophaga barathri]|uniref:hypothetical protein n=1 Tax=Chitinophaga barathri TaxID=1647451 RepID=UPI0013C514E4|nr:hypothetical protein [Chitinophaga barathri]